jgi:hypothetical protein
MRACEGRAGAGGARMMVIVINIPNTAYSIMKTHDGKSQ